MVMVTFNDHIPQKLRCIDAPLSLYKILSCAIAYIFIIYRPGAKGFSEIFPEVMIFPDGNITEGNISPNPLTPGL